MGLIKPDSAIAATPAGQNPVAAARPRMDSPAAGELPAREILIIRQNAMTNAMTSQVVAALAVTLATEQEQMALVTRWAKLSEAFVIRPFPEADAPF